MSGQRYSPSGAGEMLEIIAFRPHDQEFCVHTTTLREVRGGGPATPIPHSPIDVIGVLRDSAIPIINLANKLGMKGTEPNERSPIVVAEVHGMSMGLVVGLVLDILTISESLLLPVPRSVCRHACGALMGSLHIQRNDLHPQSGTDVQSH